MKMYLQCKYKYWSNYILGRPRKPNVSFKLGIAVHEALAYAGRIWMANSTFTIEDIENIKSIYTKTAAREGIDSAASYHDGLQMVLLRLDNFSGGKILNIEDKFEITTNEGVILTGAMDRIEEIKDSTILVTDYKTSKYVETTNELKSDIQLSIYDLVASLKFPDHDRIILSLDYLRHDPVYTYRSPADRREFVDYMTAIYKEICKLTEDDAIPSLNEMCNWCDYTDDCPAYMEAIDSKTFIKKKPETYSNQDLVREYLDVKNRKYILDNRERLLKEYIIQKIREESSDLVGKEDVLFIRQNSSATYDPKTVMESVPTDEFLKMVSVSKREVDDYLDRHPEDRVKIASTAKKTHTNPFIGRKSLKK
jgi:hypothetical protein